VRARRLRERIRVTVWNEFLHERQDPDITGIYPEGIHGAIAKHLKGRPGLEVRTATMDEPEHGLTDDALSETDVLVWWGHRRHEEVSDAVVDGVYDRIIYGGMGLIVLHSAHFSKIFKRLMGTHCNLKWREAGERERLWVVAEGHPIAEGIGDYFEVEHAEMYGEPFGIPSPDELVGAGDAEGFPVHLGVLDLEVVADPLGDGVPLGHDPEALPLSCLPPLEVAVGPHEALEDLGEVGGVEDDEPHAAIDYPVVDPVDDGVTHLLVSPVPPPDEHVGLGESIVGEAVLRLVHRGRPDLEAGPALQMLRDGAVDPLRVDPGDVGVLPLVQELVPDRDSDPLSQSPRPHIL